MNATAQQPPRPTVCHHCGKEEIAVICSSCKTERPAFTALKNITSRYLALPSVQK